MEKTLTIKDIARELNVSVSTVSRALKDNPDISYKTRRTIQEYALKNKYKPNALALGLKTMHYNIIGVIVPELANNFFSSVLAGIENIADQNNYNVIVCQSLEDYDKEKKNVQTLIKSQVSGILISQAKTTQKYEHFKELEEKGIPFVFFDRISTGVDSDKVVVDDYNGTYKAVEYMIRTGCRRIAFFSAPAHLEISKNRKNGYLDALRKYKLPTEDSLIRIADDKRLGYKEAIQMLQETQKPDAFMAINDNTASGILLAAKQLGLKIPTDVSICGFSNSNISQDTDPRLSTVDQHPKKVGEAAMEVLLKRIKNRNGKERNNRIIKTSLIARETTRKLPDDSFIIYDDPIKDNILL